MKRAVIAAVVLFAACSGSSPTAPTSTPIVNVPVTPPVVVTPPAPAFPPVDARFDLTFYLKLVHNAHEGALYLVNRFSQAPRIYLRTVDEDGRAIDGVTLDQTAAALINAAGEMTGAFGVAGMEQGTGNRIGQSGWLTVRWLPQSSNPERYCGYVAAVGREGGTLDLFPYQSNCGCGRFRIAPRVVKHELGHALGFWHTDSVNDLMWAGTWPASQCEMGMSERERYHAAIAYTRPIGSPAP